MTEGTGRAVVTGAKRGIGAAIAARLTADGFETHRIDRAPGKGVVECDVTDAASVSAVAAELGSVDVLVNNAGIWRFDKLEDVDPHDFSAVMDVNLRGALNCMQAFGPDMIDRGRGSIVNVASVAAAAANPAVGVYGPSKAALVSLTELCALEWGPLGIRCNAVGPGLVPTPGTGTVYDDPEVRAIRARAVPARRLGTSEDVAGVVSFLCSADASYVNGQTIYVDGGLSRALMTLLPRPPSVAQPDAD